MAGVCLGVATTVLAPGCGKGPYRIALSACPTRLNAKPPSTKVRVQYLGAGGFLFKRDRDVLLTAPLFSNPSLLEVALDHSARTDTELIDRYLPLDSEQARAILVGHSHYDHMLDVPYIALRRAKHADIYGSETMAHLLAPIAKALQSKTPPTRIVALDGSAGDGRKPGSWQPIGTGMRVMALRSSHSPPLALKLRVAFQEINLPVYLWRGGFVPEDLKVRLVSRPGSGGGSTDFGHLCDTLGGSSGSPVLDRQSGAVVGLHHLGIPVGAVDPVNQAVHIGLVLEDVRTRLPALHSEITTP